MATRFYHRCALIMALFAVTLVKTDQQIGRFGYIDQQEQLPASPLALRSFTDRQDKFNSGSYEPMVYDTAMSMGPVNSKHISNRASAAAASTSPNDPFYAQHQISSSLNPYRNRQQQASFNSRFSHYDDTNSDLMSRFGDVSSSYEPSNTGYASSYPASKLNNHFE